MCPWQGLSIAQHSSSEYCLGLLCWEKCLLSPVGLWQLFKCDLKMLGWALQNIFKQELPLYRKMEILLFRKLPELGFISDTSDNNTEKKNLSSCIQSASHILFTLSTSVRSWGKKNRRRNACEESKTQNAQ